MRISSIIVLGGIIVALLGIVQKFAEAPKIYWFWKPLFKDDTSFCGPFVNPNHFGGYMEMVIPLSIGPIVFDVEFCIVNLEPSFNLLLGCPWLHKHQVVPYPPPHDQVLLGQRRCRCHGGEL